MSSTPYRLVVQGELGPRYASAFEEMTVFAHDGVTEMTGPITDQSHLQGLLQRIAGLGLTLQSLTELDPESGRAVAYPPEATTSRPQSPDAPAPPA